MMSSALATTCLRPFVGRSQRRSQRRAPSPAARQAQSRCTSSYECIFRQSCLFGSVLPCESLRVVMLRDADRCWVNDAGQLSTAGRMRNWSLARLQQTKTSRCVEYPSAKLFMQSETVGIKFEFVLIVCTRSIFIPIDEHAAVSRQQRRWWQSHRVKCKFSRKHWHTPSRKLWLTGNGGGGISNPSKLRPQPLWTGKIRSLWHGVRQICLAMCSDHSLQDTGGTLGRSEWEVMWLAIWTDGRNPACVAIRSLRAHNLADSSHAEYVLASPPR